MRLVVGLLLLMPALPSTHTVHAVDSSTPEEALPDATEFHAPWSRYDTPVATGRVTRTWTWGGEVTDTPIVERYEEGPVDTGIPEPGSRWVQYVDKGRMEANPRWNPGRGDTEWRITTGLLATELLTGRLQRGDFTFEHREPADIPVAGDGRCSL